MRVPPGNHPGQLLLLLTALARINEGHGRWPIEMLLHTEASRLPHGATVVVISAIVTKPLEQTLLDLRRREYGVALVALGKAALSSPLANVPYYHIGGKERWHDLASLELA